MKLFKVITILTSLLLLTHCSANSVQKVNLSPGEVKGSIINDHMPSPIYLGDQFETQMPAYLWNGVQYLRFSLRKDEKMLHESAVFHALTKTENGAITSWYSKKRFAGGKVRVIHSFPIAGGYCRVYQAYIKVNGVARHMNNKACLHDGAITWQFLY